MCGAIPEGVVPGQGRQVAGGLQTVVFPGWRAFVRTEQSLILSATREGGCGWQVKSCLENPGRKVSRMPE